MAGSVTAALLIAALVRAQWSTDSLVERETLGNLICPGDGSDEDGSGTEIPDIVGTTSEVRMNFSVKESRSPYTVFFSFFAAIFRRNPKRRKEKRNKVDVVWPILVTHEYIYYEDIAD